jgi:hypothetical protein
MSMSYDEGKQLEEMEAQIRSDDPAFARKLRAGMPGHAKRVTSWPGLLLLLAGVLVLIVGVATQLPLIGIIGFLLIVIGGYQQVREPEPLRADAPIT